MEPTPMVDLEQQVASLASALAAFRTEENSLDRAGEELKALELLLKIRHSSLKGKGGKDSGVSELVRRLQGDPK